MQYVFDEPVITYVHPMVLAKGAPHPNAGKLLIGFILSVEGQRMLRDQGRIPAHRDVDPQVFSLRNVKLASERSAPGERIRPGGRRDARDFRSKMIGKDEGGGMRDEVKNR